MGGEREQLESVEEILMGDEKFLSGGEGEQLILGEEPVEEGEEEGETWISRTGLLCLPRISCAETILHCTLVTRTPSFRSCGSWK